MMVSEWTKKQIIKFGVLFDESDEDKNGSLRFREIVHALVKGGFRGTYREARKVFTEFDADDDKKITKKEFTDAMGKIPEKEHKVMAMREQFQMIDADNSGTLTRNELIDAVTKAEINVTTEKISDLLIYLAKEDEDKKIEYEEFLKVYNREK